MYIYILNPIRAMLVLRIFTLEKVHSLMTVGYYKIIH